MSTSTFVGNSDGLVTGLCPAPPPPPPPPPAPGQVPAMRINTAEAPTIRRPQIPSNDAYEPPAAIQNAMLTKDKKPFTYTPGMGGKLDLSQIRSPRMARRVAKNANDEGIEGPPKSALEPKPTPPPTAGVNLFIQPQVAIPVFPTNVPVQPPANRTPPTPPANKTPSTPPGNRTPPTPPGNRTPPTSPASKTPTNGLEKQPELNKVTPTVTISVQPSTPESPNTPTQVTLAKAPTPWLQNKNKPQEELPEWAKRPGAGKLSASPDSPTSPPVYVSVQQPLWQPAQQKQQPAQQRPQSQQPQQYQYQQPPQQFSQQQQKRPYSSPPGTQSAQSQQPERVIPIRIEDRPSVFDVNRDGGHHQFKQTSPHHQQRWGPSTAPNPIPNQVQQPATPIQPQHSSGGAFIIPVMMEGSEKKAAGGPVLNAGYSQPVVRNNTPSMENQTVRMAPQRGPVPIVQPESGPLQSRSFRVLQKITDTDSTNDVDPEQIRKLQLSDDDRMLMNRVKEQVDNDCFLHQEEDPRYRGAAIPSRAFRFLQSMTEGGDVPVAPINPRSQSAINKRVNRNSKTFEETQANLPPSEQQVIEPKKYMGSAIPSRSFRILQAMTAPESIATQENRQADYTCQTENNVPGNQQGVFLPPCPPPFWSPDGGWWGYYPLPYPGVANGSYPHPDHTAYIYFPIYNQNYPGYPQFDVNPLNTDKTACTGALAPSCVAPAQSAICTRSGQEGSTIVPNMESPGIPEDKSNEGKAQEDIAEMNGLNGLPRWRGNSDRGNSVSRTPSTHSKDSDCTTAMNITDEEEIPEVMSAPEANVPQPDNLEKKPCANGSLNVAVPNYTYIDTSDSTDSTDSESQSDNESVIETSKSDRVSEDTTSDSEDSDSYMAYSLGLNPHGRFDKDAGKSGARTGSGKEALNGGHESENPLEKNNNSDSEREEQVDGQVEEAGGGSFPHKLSVIYEDVEHVDAESPRPQEPRGGWNKTPFEATDDPPDEQDTTTVSVSLPLRFKFSVSENNEDVTTVIVGDSTVKPERVSSKDETRGVKAQEQRSLERTEEVSANFLVDNDTSVDFTVKREKADTRRPRNHSKEAEKEEVAERKAEKGEDTVVPHVNFTLRKIPTRLSRMNCGETIATEFTVKRKTSARKEESRDKEQNCSDTSNQTIPNGESLGEEANPIQTAENTVHVSNMKESNFEPLDYNKNILKPEVVVSECKEPGNLHSANSKVVRSEKSEDSDSSKSNRKEEDPEKEPTKEPRHLLSVQNSKDETDDEDSGVTSDMSRMISEVDTDSECTSMRNRKYQRTQTHSRLFKLLNDDSVLPEDIEKTPDSPSRRDYLSLPLKNSFNYDDNYCSNYSSGITSPDYSPLCEQTWRRLHDAERPNVTTNPRLPDQDGDAGRDHGHPLSRQERAFCKDDPYYQSWKTCKSPTPNDHDVLPSQAFKVLESRRPLWSYRVNVLCPRIKSTKSVPVALGAGKNDSPLISPNPSAYVTLRNDRC